MFCLRVPEKVYFKKGSMPIALDELGTVMNKKKALIITDSFLYKNGYIKAVEKKLNEMGIQHTVFFDIPSEPTLDAIKQGVREIKLFEPDVIIAFGGGSVIDSGKLMRLLYENPERDIFDFSARFFDEQVQKLKTYFVAVPTTSGTGSEVTAFAVVSDDSGKKHKIADYRLLPDMAIVDADNMMNQPKELTGKVGMTALAHAVLAYSSERAAEYTDGLALNAIKDIFEYLPSAYGNGANDPTAREKLAAASTMAGIAYGNVSYIDADEKNITDVIKADKNGFERYCECAKFIGVGGKDSEEVFAGFIAKIEELERKCGIK